MTIGENFFRRYQSADYQAIHTLENTLVSNFRLYLVHFFLGFVFLCVNMVSIYVYKWMIYYFTEFIIFLINRNKFLEVMKLEKMKSSIWMIPASTVLGLGYSKCSCLNEHFTCE